MPIFALIPPQPQMDKGAFALMPEEAGSSP